MSSAAEDVGVILKGREGGNITLTDPVVELGFLSHGKKTVAMVTRGEIEIVEDIYKNRLLWNQNSGFFTITDLQRIDSGIYTIDSKKPSVFTASYNLTVYGKLCSVLFCAVCHMYECVSQEFSWGTV